MAAWVETCPDVTPTPPASCSQALVLVDVSAAQPFTLTEAHLANMGQAFSAGLIIVAMFWGLGFAAGLILNAIRHH